MSIQAIAYVLEESEVRGFNRLVFLAIANHADAYGKNANPSIEQIAWEARVHRATVFRAIEALERLGELEITRGGGRNQRSSYTVLFKRSHAATQKRSQPVAKRSHAAKSGLVFKPYIRDEPLTSEQVAQGKANLAACRAELRDQEAVNQ